MFVTSVVVCDSFGEFTLTTAVKGVKCTSFESNPFEADRSWVWTDNKMILDLLYLIN